MHRRPLPARLRVLAAGWIAAGLLLHPCAASDHADPMNLLNPFETQPDPEANITDLHAFIVDKEGKPVAPRQAEPGDQLVISLCVRRALTSFDPKRGRRASDSIALKLDDYTYRVHLDWNPAIGFFDEAEFQATKARLETELRALEEKYKDANEPPEELTEKAGELGTHLNNANAARAAQARYGGTFQRPSDIAGEASLEFKFRYHATDKPDTDSVSLVHKQLKGTWTGDREMTEVPAGGKPETGKINVQAGIFDDPFVFPRFFRRNVVGVVTMIPLDRLPVNVGQPGTRCPIVLWATTHENGRQIDHVGRSLRTQLPRFGYLNPLDPSKHVATIQRVQRSPSLVEDAFSTFVGPLFAHRHFDDVPDVMIYDLNQPAIFPNGRTYEDDVARILAEGGETLLLELSYAESEQFPRATENDKAFRRDFPFLAERWTTDMISKAGPGTAFVRNNGQWGLRPYDALGEVRAEASFAPATEKKLLVLKIAGVLAVLGVLGAVLGLGYYLGRHRGLKEAGMPADEGQGAQPGEDTAAGSCFAELEEALIEPATCRPYRGPGVSSDTPLPRHKVSFWKVAMGILPWGKPSLLAAASRRTVKVRTDLRWGKDKKGVQRLIHPNGICLSGEWIIDGIKKDGGFGPTGYTGWFEQGRTGLVIARWSPARSETRRGHWRSNGLTGKIYPTTDKSDRSVTKSASFFTQEDLGGTKAEYINQMEFRNGPDLHAWRRGKGVFSLILSGLVFARVNVNGVIRQLHEIAELSPQGAEPVAKPRCPTFMRLKVISEFKSDAADVRDEILEHIYGKDYPNPQRELILAIEVTNHPQDQPDISPLAPKIERMIPDEKWQRIGRLVFKRAACGYNGDFVVHFHHPAWRTDPNDPDTQAPVK
jgi:hypothetical protein